MAAGHQKFRDISAEQDGQIIPRANECKTEKAIGSDSLFCCPYKNTSKPLIFEMQTSRTVRISLERRNLMVRVPL